jgi:aminopeptidase N
MTKYITDRRLLLILSVFMFWLAYSVTAQDLEYKNFPDNKSFYVNNLDNSLADPRLLLYDITFYYIDLEVSNTSTSVRGFTEIHGSSLNTEISELVFELSGELTIDSLFMNGSVDIIYIHANDLVIINPDSVIHEGENFIARIYYHGEPGNNGFFSGVSNRIDYNWNQKVTYTLSEPFNAKTWFPCKQVLTDKADSAYIFITTDTSLMAGSNGLLTNITQLPGGRQRFEWKTSYPIAFYLLSFTVADYRDYSIYAHPGGNGDSLLVQNYIFDNTDFLEVNREDIDATADMIELYSGLFSTYPFPLEKYGHCFAPMGGGMEHQTMTTLSSFNFSLVAHELGHQWFGDYVTCATWQDIWINEGFASYTEYIALENLVSYEDAALWMIGAHEVARTEPDGSVFIPEQDINDERRIFSGPLSYKKGAAILHMIRYELNNDSLFFSSLRTFISNFKDSTATGLDFMEVLKAVSGQDFNWFFDQWYFGKGYPVFSMTWWQEKDTLFIVSSQTGSSIETPFFRTHIDFRLRFVNGTDTLIRSEQIMNNQTFSIPVSEFVSDVLPDPDNWLLDVITIVKKPLQNGVFNVGPNPFTDDIWIEFNTSNIRRDIIISDMTGKILGRYETESAVISLPLKNLIRGIYMFTVMENGKSYSTKIVKE